MDLLATDDGVDTRGLAVPAVPGVPAWPLTCVNVGDSLERAVSLLSLSLSFYVPVSLGQRPPVTASLSHADAKGQERLQQWGVSKAPTLVSVLAWLLRESFEHLADHLSQ
jgi:hypothetical protein